MMTGRDTWTDVDEEGSDYKELVTYKEVVYYDSQGMEMVFKSLTIFIKLNRQPTA